MIFSFYKGGHKGISKAVSPFSKGGQKGDFGNGQQLENLPPPLFRKEGSKSIFPLCKGGSRGIFSIVKRYQNTIEEQIC
ncbi:MAG: hypothetical protein NC937_03005 [Candidatus Omnitrophica bacterium]|nr:hypothetical protein [Candidatus Omnitrophota bacterium]